MLRKAQLCSNENIGIDDIRIRIAQAFQKNLRTRMIKVPVPTGPPPIPVRGQLPPRPGQAP